MQEAVLTLKAPRKLPQTTLLFIFFFFFHFYLLKKIRLDVSCESSASGLLIAKISLLASNGLSVCPR